MSPLLELVIIDRAEDDLGPATKLLPALKRETNPATRLVTVDDDTTYHEDLLLALALAADTTKDPVAVGFWCEEFGWSPETSYFFMHATRRRECLGMAVEGFVSLFNAGSNFVAGPRSSSARSMMTNSSKGDMRFRAASKAPISCLRGAGRCRGGLVSVGRGASRRWRTGATSSRVMQSTPPRHRRDTPSMRGAWYQFRVDSDAAPVPDTPRLVVPKLPIDQWCQ